MPTTTPFNNLITFSRGSNATLTGPNGLIQWAPNNLLTFSEQFDNAAWTKSNVTVTANNAAAPDGTTTADTVAATANGQSYIRQNATVIANTPYTTSIYLRAGTVSWCLLEIWNSGVTKWSGRYINLSTGALGGSTSGGGGLGGVFSVTDAGGGWYRIIVTATSDNTVLTPALYVADGDGDINVLAGNGISMWGAQLELGSTATTYNPTTVKNLLGFSEAFDNAAWSKTRASIVTGAQANPINGLFNAQKLMEDTTASATHPVSVGFTFAAIPYTMSVYAKAAGRNWIYLAMLGTTNSFASFNLSNGTVGTVGAAATAAIQDVGNGWYRCRITSTATAGAGTAAFYPASADNTISYTGDGNSGVYIYGALLSDSASLDPYVPTPGAAPSSTAFYGPRFDFDPVTRAPRGLLVEEQRTNLVLQSNAFTTSPWGLDPNTDFTANSTASPDGSVNAWKMAAKNGLGANGQSQFFTKAASAITYNTSIFSKAAGYDWLQIAVFDGTNGNRYWFNVRTGTIGTTAVIGTGFTGVSASITPVANGFFRCSLIATSSTATSYFMYIYPSATNGSNGTGNANGDGVFVYGAQIEAGAFATSYIPTVASTVTRSADVATISGQNFAQWYRQDEGTWAFDFGPFNFSGTIAGSAPYDAAFGAVTNGIRNGRQFSVQNQFGWVAQNKTGTPSGSTQIAGSAALAPLNGPAVAQKLAAFQSPSAIGGVVNGGTVTTTTLSSAPTGAADLFYINPLINGHIRNIRFIPARAADFQLQALST